MKFWKNWPYWLRGGVVATILGILSVIAADFCGDVLLEKYPNGGMGDFQCVIFYTPSIVFYGSIALAGQIIPGFSEGVDSLFDSNIFGNFETLIMVLPWTLTGILIGLFISWLKKRKQRKLNQV